MIRFVLICLSFVLIQVSHSQNLIKIDPLIIEDLNSQSIIPVIVEIKNITTKKPVSKKSTKLDKTTDIYRQLSLIAQESQSDIATFLTSQEVTFQSFYIVNAISLQADKKLIYSLSERDDVLRILSNPQTAMDYIEEPLSIQNRMAEPEWGIKMIQADSVWALGIDGSGVIIAGQDTGYEFEHPALLTKYRGYSPDSNYIHDYNWHDAIHEISLLHGDSIVDPSNNPCGLDVTYPCDDHNHGTHTMGTMIGSDDNNSIGVAPGATWIACRNMERGYGSPSTYLECFQWFLAPTDLNNENPDPSAAPHVINNSWSCPEMEGCNSSNWSIMNQAVENLRAAGVVVVVSAGNRGSNCETVRTPAAMYPGSFSVGATASNDTIAGFSSRGPVAIDSSFRLKPDISAPGVNVRSCIRNDNYASFSGTSMAGPHVAGLVGLIISANPSLAGQVEVIEEIIKSTAVPKTTEQDCGEYLGANIPNAVYGYGRINALAAVEQALLISDVSNIVETPTIKVFPNPSSDYLTIQTDEVFQKIVIVDALGHEIYRSTQPAQDVLIHCSPWARGHYHYQVWINSTVVAGTLVKM